MKPLAPEMSPSAVVFIQRSFRDMADQDYLLARVAYRHRLYLPFIWLSHQAIEKYLKALLLFNGRSSVQLRHDVTAAFDEVLTIADIPFGFPAQTREFMMYLDAGASRYFEFPFSVKTQNLVSLDRTVWFLRRFCDYIRGTTTRSDFTVVDRLPYEIERRTNNRYTKFPNEFRVWGGYLEVVKDDRKSKLRPHLVWNNLYFSRRRRTTLSAGRSFAANSDVSLYPSLVSELDGLVHFSRDLKRRVKGWR